MECDEHHPEEYYKHHEITKPIELRCIDKNDLEATDKSYQSDNEPKEYDTGWDENAPGLTDNDKVLF